MQKQETTASMPLRNRYRFLGIALASLLVASLAIGCGGEDNGDSGSDASPAAATATVESGGGPSSPAEPTATSSSSSAPGPTAASSDSSSNDVTASQLASLSSYKYKLAMSGSGGPMTGLTDALGTDATEDVSMEVTGAYVAPDQAQTTISLGELEITQTVLGDQQWTSFGGLTQGPTPATATDLQDTIFISSFWDDSDFQDTISQFSCEDGPEEVNGVQAVKCGIDADTYAVLRDQLGGFFGEDSDIQDLSDFNFQVWLTADGIPVRMRVHMVGQDSSGADFELTMEMDITDINSNFQIEEPS